MSLVIFHIYPQVGNLSFCKVVGSSLERFVTQSKLLRWNPVGVITTLSRHIPCMREHTRTWTNISLARWRPRWVITMFSGLKINRINKFKPRKTGPIYFNSRSKHGWKNTKIISMNDLFFEITGNKNVPKCWQKGRNQLCKYILKKNAEVQK